ncbi:ferrous iron transport protein A [Candidatus Comchoanobacter bicostacola]|uniref:Ferrous iron transport protein A n=1 Tax=Candidatus Comchoanobacter bicostacola TaxID=2919598 RepID=A0ABY5DIK1_9GAMM|nr:ferrous iron transport protein A [Candidatus Comchoanobacter bicostacola]UTC24423.1 ferrous iron transport protein A [Candidatus Comchoanobacter bicostacola]
MNAGQIYHILGYETDCIDLRNKLISMGFIPGIGLKIEHIWFFGYYAIISAGTQTHGLRTSLLEKLKLHKVCDD